MDVFPVLTPCSSNLSTYPEAEVQEYNAGGSLRLRKKVAAKIVPNVYSVMPNSGERLCINVDHMLVGCYEVVIV